MTATTSAWQDRAREHALRQFRDAWAAAPGAGRQALLDAVTSGRVGHRWETGSRACVLALLVGPLVRPRESPKTAAYRFFGSEVTEDFPVTWDASGVTVSDLLAAVGVSVPVGRRDRHLKRRLLAPVLAVGTGVRTSGG